jgi:hypothetical protein
MRKTGFAVLTVFVALAMLAPPALAQAPAAKVTINGLVDQVTQWNRNLSMYDSNPSHTGDSMWYARTRFRPDLTGEVGAVKAVLGIEIDYAWGTVGTTDITGTQASGTSAGADLNTDLRGIMEVKWAYTEFGTPWIEGSRLRLGAQPFDVTLKPGILATGDFAGAHFSWGAVPGIKLNGTYAQIDEKLTGPRDGFTNGDDFVIFASADISPWRGLDLRPLWSYLSADGTTGARLGRGGVSNTTAFFGTGAAQEERHTIGVDGRWKMGPFYIDPTALFQFGQREIFATVGRTGKQEQDISAWLFDARGGWQWGPLLLEGAVTYTSGNKAGEDVRDAGEDVNYFEPITTDSGYWGTWAEVFALNTDFTSLYGFATGPLGLNMPNSIGYDKYGLIGLGGRAAYALTPAFTVRGGATMRWTAEEVDTSSTLASATGLTPVDGKGDDRYLGTELNLGFQYRFAPNVALDLAGAYLLAGDALATATSTAPNGTVRTNRDPQDIQSIAARVRYTF